MNLFCSGVLQKIDYFKEIGVDTVWLAPVYSSPMVDMGYDISDFNDIDPTFGNMDDFDALTAKCKEMGKLDSIECGYSTSKQQKQTSRVNK